MKTIDCRGLACPAPVVAVKNALDNHQELRVMLDDGAPRENVARFARNRGFSVLEESDNSNWVVTITATGNEVKPEMTLSAPGNRIFLVTSDLLGDGPPELGRLLMKNFIHTLLETCDLPSQMFFMNRGIFLTTEGSDVLEALEKIAGMGVEIFSCGLCLDFFDLKSKLRVGGTTNMLTTVESMLSSALVVKL